MDVWLSFTITLRPTKTGSPAGFPRHWPSLAGVHRGLSHTANPTRVGMALLPAGSELAARLWTHSPSCFYLGYFFLRRLNPDFFLRSLLQTNCASSERSDHISDLLLKSTCAVHVRQSHLLLRKCLRLIFSGNITSTCSPGWITSPTSSISQFCDQRLRWLRPNIYDAFNSQGKSGVKHCLAIKSVSSRKVVKHLIIINLQLCSLSWLHWK